MKDTGWPAKCRDCGRFIGKDGFAVEILTYWEHDMDFYCVKCGEKRGMKHNKEDE